MRYSFTAGQLATLRVFPQATAYSLAVHRPRVVTRGILGAVPSTYPGNSLAIASLVAGLNLTDVKAGMTMYVGSEGTKSDYGTLRIRKAPSGSTIYTAEFGSGLINWQSGASITIVEDYRLWPIHPSYDSAASHWLVDLDTYTDQTKNFGPQVIMGPHMIGEMNSGKMLASYVGNLSYSHTTGVSITSQTWTFPNGQTVTSALGSSSNPIVITYLNASPNGGIHTLKVTDSNGASHIGQRLTFAFGSGTNQPIDSRFEQITGGIKSGGYRTKVYIDEGATSTNIVDGARVIIFEKASYGSFTQSVGGNYFARDNVVLTSRVVADSQRIEPFTNGVSFDLETDDGEMRRAQGYDVFLESGSAASDWDMASGLTIDKAALVLAKYRSTIANVMDFNLAGGVATTNEIPYRDLPAGFLFDALNYNYAAEFGSVAVDMQGSLWAMLDTQVTGLSANVANVTAITLADRRDTVTIGHPHREVNSTTRLYAVQGGIAEPIAADSPGDRIGYFGNRQEVSQNLTAPTQDVLITWAGNVRARDNNPYNNITIPLAGNMRIDPVPQSYVTMSLSSTQSPRGVNWNNQKIIPNEITINYNPESQYANTEIVGEMVVNGIGGSAFTFPVDNVPPGSPPPPPPPPPPPGTEPGDRNTMFGLINGVDNKIIRTFNFLDASPTWADITGTVTGNFCNFGFRLDPWNPANKAIVLTAAGIWICSNVTDPVPVWTCVLTYLQVASLTAANIQITTRSMISTSIHKDGRLYLMVGGPKSTNRDVYVGRTEDYTTGSAGWSFTKIGTSTGPPDAHEACMHVAQYGNDKIFVSFRQPADTFMRLFYSSDYAVTFAEKSFAGESFDSRDAAIFVSYLNDNNTIYMLNGTTTGTVRVLRTTTGPTGTWSDITPNIGGELAAFITVEGITESPASDGNNLYFCVSDGTTLSQSGLYKYGNGSWTQLQPVAVGLRWAGYGFGGWPWNNSWMQMSNSNGDGIQRSEDGGVTWVDATGNLLTIMANPNAILSMVPVWLAY